MYVVFVLSVEPERRLFEPIVTVPLTVTTIVALAGIAPYMSVS